MYGSVCSPKSRKVLEGIKTTLKDFGLPTSIYPPTYPSAHLLNDLPTYRPTYLATN